MISDGVNETMIKRNGCQRWDKMKTWLVGACLLLLAGLAGAEPPNSFFAPGGVGLNVPLQNDMQVSSYGTAVFLSGGWAMDGDAARTIATSETFARYSSTVQAQSEVTAMPTNQDWLIVIEYQHTGAYSTDNAPW